MQESKEFVWDYWVALQVVSKIVGFASMDCPKDSWTRIEKDPRKRPTFVCMLVNDCISTSSFETNKYESFQRCSFFDGWRSFGFRGLRMCPNMEFQRNRKTEFRRSFLVWTRNDGSRSYASPRPYSCTRSRRTLVCHHKANDHGSYARFKYRSPKRHSKMPRWFHTSLW